MDAIPGSGFSAVNQGIRSENVLGNRLLQQGTSCAGMDDAVLIAAATGEGTVGDGGAGKAETATGV